MKCPRCGRRGHRRYRGYCGRAHRDLEAKQKVVKLHCARCGTTVLRVPSRVSAKVYCQRCPKNSADTHSRWRDGQYINPAGYRLVLHNNAYLLEHRLTWERANRACLLPGRGGNIHHINFDKTDNRPQNLILLSAQEHGRIHKLIDNGKYGRAQCRLIMHAEQQAFFLLHLEHLESIRDLSIRDILA